MNWPEIKKRNCHFERLVFSYAMKQQQTISWSDCDIQRKVDCIQQPATATSVVGQRRSSKAFPKANLAPKKRSWSLFGGLLAIWVTIPFWISAKPLHLRSMLSKPMRCTENQHLQPALVNIKSPTLLHNNAWPHFTQPMLQKTNKLGFISLYKVLSHLSYSPDLLTTSQRQLSPTSCQPFDLLPTLTISSSISATFLQGKHFHNQQNAEKAF